MNLRLANTEDQSTIWEIIQQAIAQRHADGSNQWQNGYPNINTIANDIKNGYGFVLINNEIIYAYAALIFAVEPAYNLLKGNWLSYGDYAVVHRIAVSQNEKGKGLGKLLLGKIEQLVKGKSIDSIKIDTNFDNAPMLHILKQSNYTYCGEIVYDDSPRMAFEKILI